MSNLANELREITRLGKVAKIKKTKADKGWDAIREAMKNHAEAGKYEWYLELTPVKLYKNYNIEMTDLENRLDKEGIKWETVWDGERDIHEGNKLNNIIGMKLNWKK